MPATAGVIAVVALAAGKGGRMGGNKMLLPWKNRPLLVHVLEAALRLPSLHSVTVVLGCDAERVLAALERHFGPYPPFDVVRNPDWRDGQSASLRHGLASILARPDGEKIAGVMFLLGNQPLIRAQTLADLLSAHTAPAPRETACMASAPSYRGQRGNPVILSRALFPRIAELRGDAGARGILDELGDGLRLVQVGDPGVCRDIDTPDAYAALLDGRDEG
jgi:molybdenum cofactor cytidylyltransferase